MGSAVLRGWLGCRLRVDQAKSGLCDHYWLFRSSVALFELLDERLTLLVLAPCLGEEDLVCLKKKSEGDGTRYS